MAEVTNELMFEVLKAVQDRLGRVDGKMDEVKGELQAVRTHLSAIDRIEVRLGLAEPAH